MPQSLRWTTPDLMVLWFSPHCRTGARLLSSKLIKTDCFKGAVHFSQQKYSYRPFSDSFSRPVYPAKGSINVIKNKVWEGRHASSQWWFLSLASVWQRTLHLGKREIVTTKRGETINTTSLLTSNSVRVTNSARLPCFHGGTAAHTWKECMRVNVRIHRERAVTWTIQVMALKTVMKTSHQPDDQAEK